MNCFMRQGLDRVKAAGCFQVRGYFQGKKQEGRKISLIGDKPIVP